MIHNSSYFQFTLPSSFNLGKFKTLNYLTLPSSYIIVTIVFYRGSFNIYCRVIFCHA